MPVGTSPTPILLTVPCSSADDGQVSPRFLSKVRVTSYLLGMFDGGGGRAYIGASTADAANIRSARRGSSPTSGVHFFQAKQTFLKVKFLCCSLACKKSLCRSGLLHVVNSVVATTSIRVHCGIQS
jgi:hypothetical protein